MILLELFGDRGELRAARHDEVGVLVDDVRQAVKDLADKGVNVEKLPMTGDDGIASHEEAGDAHDDCCDTDN